MICDAMLVEWVAEAIDGVLISQDCNVEPDNPSEGILAYRFQLKAFAYEARESQNASWAKWSRLLRAFGI